MIKDEFNNICKFRELNPAIKGNGLKANDPALLPVKKNLEKLRDIIKEEIQEYKGFNYDFVISKGVGYFPSILHISILPKEQKVSNGIYVVLCFDKLGKGALVGCAESMTNPRGLNTMIRTINNKSIDVDGERPNTKYNHSFENPKEFFRDSIDKTELINHIKDSLKLALYHLKLSGKSELNVNKRVNAKYSKHDLDFDASDIEERRETTSRNITIRRGQKQFRDALIEAYNGKCAITGSSTIGVLEAAHIMPYNGNKTNHTQNGLLLRSDLHTLFDLGLLTISHENYQIILHDSLKTSEYAKFHRISLPLKEEHYPSEDALKWHNENEFQK